MSYYDRVLADLLIGREPGAPEHCGASVTVEKAIYPQVFRPGEPPFGNIAWVDDLYSYYQRLKGQKIVKDIIVHGSYGDFSYTNFSDLEVTLYLENFYGNKELCKAAKTSIKKLNSLLLKIDPLQHHGAFFIWDDFLENYDESILPICAYNQCWSFSGDKIPITVTSDIESLLEKSQDKYISTLTALSRPRKHYFKHGLSLYAVKRFISNLFMIPVFFYQAKGFQLNKRDALREIKHESLHLDFFESLELASHMRNHWPGRIELMSFMRRMIVRTRIPQGPLDSVLCSLFVDSEIASILDKKLMPLVEKSATQMLQMVSNASR